MQTFREGYLERREQVGRDTRWWPYAGPQMSAEEFLERAIWHDEHGEDELCTFYLGEAVRFEAHYLAQADPNVF